MLFQILYQQGDATSKQTLYNTQPHTPFSVIMEIREWSLKWAQGCVIGYIKGTLEEKRAVGMLKRAIDWGVKKEELKNILDSVKISPLYLPSISSEYKAEKISELEKLLELK